MHKFEKCERSLNKRTIPKNHQALFNFNAAVFLIQNQIHFDHNRFRLI